MIAHGSPGAERRVFVGEMAGPDLATGLRPPLCIAAWRTNLRASAGPASLPVVVAGGHSPVRLCFPTSLEDRRRARGDHSGLTLGAKLTSAVPWEATPGRGWRSGLITWRDRLAGAPDAWRRRGIPFCVADGGNILDRSALCFDRGVLRPAKIRWRLVVVQQRDLAIDYQGLEYLGFATPRRTHWNLPRPRWCNWRSPVAKACWWRTARCAPPPARIPGGARTIASSSTSPACATPSTGARSTGRSRRARAPPVGQGAGARGAARAVRPGPARRRRSGAPTPRAGRHRDRLARAVRAQHVPRAAGERARRFIPDFTVLQLPSLEADPATDGTRSNVAIVLDFAARTVLICGTRYAGEIKKSIFTVLNHLLPAEGVFPMHCSANVGDGATSRSSSVCPARARRRSRRIPRAR